MSGRNDNGLLVNNSSSQQAKLFVDAYRTNFTYPSWFENTLGYAESGQITVLELQKAADNLLNQGLMKPKPSFQIFTGNQKQAIDQRIENMYGDDINLLHGNVEMLGTTMTESFDLAQAGREANQSNITSNTGKIENLITEQQNIYDSIGQKSDKSHTHAGTGKDCGMFGINCLFQDMGKYALIAGVGIVAFFLLKKRIGL